VQLRPCHAEQQDRGARRQEPSSLDKVEERLVAPLDVVEDDDERCLLLQQLAERPGDLLRTDDTVGLAKQRADRVRGAGVLGPPSELLDDLDDRPVGDAVAVRRAPAAHNSRVDLAQSLRDEARLADARVADDGHELAPLLTRRALPRLADRRHLALSPDEGCVVRPLRRLVDRLEPVRRDAFRLPLQLQRLHGSGVDGAADEIDRRFAEKNLVWIGRLLQARRHVDGIARCQSLRRADDNLARVHPDPPAHAEVGKCVSHLRDRTDRPQRVVLVDRRHAEDGHHRVADELLDGAPVRLDDRAHPLEVAGQQRLQRLRIRALAERRRADDVAEDHRDDLAMHVRIIAYRSVGIEQLGRRTNTRPRGYRRHAPRLQTTERPRAKRSLVAFGGTKDERFEARFWGQVRGFSRRRRALRGDGAASGGAGRIAGKGRTRVLARVFIREA
jgi:hypothetical protein